MTQTDHFLFKKKLITKKDLITKKRFINKNEGTTERTLEINFKS